MWVKCQNGMVIDVKNFYVEENITIIEGCNKISITDGYNVSTYYEGKTFILGNYTHKSTVEGVKEIMIEKIHQSSMYQMPKEILVQYMEKDNNEWNFKYYKEDMYKTTTVKSKNESVLKVNQLEDQNAKNTHIVNITLPNVQNSEEFVRGLKEYMNMALREN